MNTFIKVIIKEDSNTWPESDTSVCYNDWINGPTRFFYLVRKEKMFNSEFFWLKPINTPTNGTEINMNNDSLNSSEWLKKMKGE